MGSSRLVWFSSAVALFFAPAALAKLTDGRTLEEVLDTFGEEGIGGGEFAVSAGGGVKMRVLALRSEAVRELVREMAWAAFAASRSLSSRSATSFSRDETSTGLQNRS